MVTKKELANGVTLTVLPTTQFKTTRIVLNFIAPLAAATITQRSLLASLLETNSQDYPTQADLAAKLSALYGANFGISVSKRGNVHVFSVVMTVVNDKFLPGATTVLTEGLAFLKQVLWRPNVTASRFDAATFNREKTNMQAYLASVYDNKQAYASLQLQELYFKNSTAQRVPSFGNEADLQAITASSLYTYYQQMLAQDQVAITVLGDVDAEQVTALLTDLPLTARTADTTDLFYQQPAISSVVEKTDIQPTNQAKLNLAYQVPTYYYQPNYYALLMANGIFGGSPMSLLFTNVRERASLAYYASSSYDAFRGLITVQTGIDAANVAQVKQIIATQLATLQAGEFSNELLAQTKATLKNQYITGLDSAGYLTSQELVQQLVPASAVATEEFIAQLTAVTKEQIVAAAQTIKLQAVYFLSSQEAGK
ncbi:EF-P 5-aminopentanol modification-associated protein YfmF [Loigolactobacillus jiayinensis]|uniref:EF-P 5-aminopentanol modification-associated protein YfmF n=1 Tax=Loigolactobacillus jiayinensis TaxID=2486016 RepID=A0ABW1RA80_9LACO|nr:pitrilysin family protein [Loigolactobacillus jiayinensis]